MFNFWPDVTHHSASAFFPFLFYKLHNKMQDWSGIFSQFLLPWLTDQRFSSAFFFALEILGDSRFLFPISRIIHSAFWYQTSIEKSQDLHSAISRIGNPLKKKNLDLHNLFLLQHYTRYLQYFYKFLYKFCIVFICIVWSIIACRIFWHSMWDLLRSIKPENTSTEHPNDREGSEA